MLRVAKAKTGFFGQRNYLYYLLGKKTGYRVSETLSLRVKHLWVDGRVALAVHVEKDHMKGKRDRRPVPLQSQVRDEIHTYLTALARQCGSTLATLDPETPVFLSRKQRVHKEQPQVRRSMSRQQAYVVLQALYAEAAVSRHDGKALANHTLRKTFAMRIYEGTQHNIFLTSKALGHASIDMTQKYLGISDEEVAAAILLAA
jgi:integrase